MVQQAKNNARAGSRFNPTSSLQEADFMLY
jgi:hypothetical protein